MLMDIQCPNCDASMWLKHEYLLNDSEHSFYRCSNAACLNNNCLRNNLANQICLQDYQLEDYKLPILHSDGKIYYLHSYKELDKTIALVEGDLEVSRLMTIDKFYPIKLNEPINKQLSTILVRILNLVNFI